jgi:uncharacterized protein (TIGR00725 family)
MLNNNKTEYLCYNGPIGNGDKHNHLKLKIGVCGAAETGTCGPNAFEQGKELGRQIIRQGGILVTGATTGFPLWTAIGAKEEKGVSIGISPASNEREHVDTYRLPLEYMDLIMYTGFGFPGRDLLFTRSCDAVILGCGRIGTIHEFTIAFEDGKPIGILEGEWTMSDTIRQIIARANRPNDKIVFDKDPQVLVQKIIELASKSKSPN